jgi:hypothetical protein
MEKWPKPQFCEHKVAGVLSGSIYGNYVRLEFGAAPRAGGSALGGGVWGRKRSEYLCRKYS